nr:MAG TPA: hypothetical protein [Caudoviricetes sp.]
MTENTPRGVLTSVRLPRHFYTNRTTQPTRKERENDHHHPPH